MGSSEKLTEYERRRLENIKRNEDMMHALKIPSTQLSLRRTHADAVVVDLEKKKPKTQKKTATTIEATRKSLRTRGMSPEYTGATSVKTRKPPPTRNSSLPLETLNQAISGISKKKTHSVEQHHSNSNGGGDFDLQCFTLKPENVARVVPAQTSVLRVFPTADARIIAAGNGYGDIGFWDVDKGNEVYRYRLHEGAVTGISIRPSSLSKIFTSCDAGFIQLMDAEKEVFNLVYSGDHAIFSLSQHPNDVNCLYFSEGRGRLSFRDERSGISTSWNLHIRRINSIDFNLRNPYIMATSSTDGTACIWDVRSIDVDKSIPLKIISHKRAVHSAYFSPSGSCLATTSVDTVRILSGDNFEDVSMIDHYHKDGGILSFRAIWGWDDSYVFIGNKQYGIDVISSAQRKIIMTLQSPHISGIPRQFDAHPYQHGMLAGTAGGSQIYIWTSN